MHHRVRLTRMGALLCSVLACLLSLQLMGLASVDPPQSAHWAEARARWSARAPDSYYIAVRIEALGRVCVQRLEVRSGWVRRVLENTCNTLWIDPLTVDQLFALSSDIESIPASRCVPSPHTCPCHRVFTLRRIEYDAEYGFPSTIIARSKVQFHPMRRDFWEYLWTEGSLPVCQPARRRFTVQVLTLMPLPPESPAQTAEFRRVR
ncbi:MAG: hypothetical protein J7455_11690 [Roseiflexus sp.]|jgi:hypothetical protein|nr:hypothetical protein [Roseiflexus sp.]MBO9365060.1 hypothetical protein [Roseiflexus sp.]MBO9382207.1 hypothetical protein [Roseiflexus sp.]MBO9389742.1 hypothetical protein [Roseiflexus sp.]